MQMNKNLKKSISLAIKMPRTKSGGHCSGVPFPLHSKKKMPRTKGFPSSPERARQKNAQNPGR